MSKATVYGWGINDANYPVTREERINGNGKRVWTCPFYRAWSGMLQRCYSEKRQDSAPTYRGCSVCPEWRQFSRFKAWMESQDWGGKSLDKDIIKSGNRVYSPEACAFVDQKVNSFILDKEAGRGRHPIGVSKRKGTGKYEAHCNNPITGVREYLGVFVDVGQAHEAWRRRKHEIACEVASLQSDERVARALRVRYCTSQQANKPTKPRRRKVAVAKHEITGYSLPQNFPKRILK